MVKKGLGILFKTETVAIFHLRINSLFLIQGKRNRLHFMRLCVKFNINLVRRRNLNLCKLLQKIYFHKASKPKCDIQKPFLAIVGVLIHPLHLFISCRLCSCSSCFSSHPCSCSCSYFSSHFFCSSSLCSLTSCLCCGISSCPSSS